MSEKQPRFPIYIPSKNRWETRYTVRALQKMGVEFLIIIEESQYKDYSSVIPKKNILILDKNYQDNYKTCDDLGNSKGKGPGPARNFAWDHAISRGYDWHWVMDDNITTFYRFNKNLYRKVISGLFFRIMEDFILRYENIGMAGPNYEMFVPRKQKYPPFIVNTRIYSCNLIRNDLPFRWRGRYNEDTILSLDMLKAGWCTVQFNAFLQKKIGTQRVKGGNTEEFYSKEGTYPKSKMLVDIHPDVSRLTWRFNRVHHYVNYKRFKKLKLRRKKDLEIQETINEFGMRLKDAK